MNFLHDLANNSQFPIITALVLGLIMAISPCPLATNISAIGYISKDLSSKKRVFLNGIYYTLGRIISYTVLGIILIIILRQGSSIFHIQKIMRTYGELFIGPLLILIGIFLSGIINLRLPQSGRFAAGIEKKAASGSAWGSILLGIVFALAFCPYSGVIYFGGLIPLAVSANSGYSLPVFFAIATGLPVIIFAWILAFSVSKVGSVYNKVKSFEFWFRRIISVLFIIIGLYFCWMVYIK